MPHLWSDKGELEFAFDETILLWIAFESASVQTVKGKSFPYPTISAPLPKFLGIQRFFRARKLNA